MQRLESARVRTSLAGSVHFRGLPAEDLDRIASLGRVSSLKPGDPVEFYGEYEWTERGGVVHWTHRDPQRSHADGWIKHNGHTYQ